jgi:hypothetical protein
MADMLGVLGVLAWWYFDSTSFPYQTLWRFSLSIFLVRRGVQENAWCVGAHQENA